MGIRDKPIAPASPWQNSYAERLIGSIRRECLDHMVVLGGPICAASFGLIAAITTRSGRHRSLGKDAPVHRPIEPNGNLSSRPILGGLHHHYRRI
jgi:hypothetical protein